MFALADSDANEKLLNSRLQTNVIDERSSKLEEVVSRMNRIPVLSKVSVDVIREIDNPNISCRRMAEIVSNDPVMVAELLKLANSAFFGVRVRVNTVQQATSLLGINSVSSLVVSLALMDSPKAYEDIPLFDVHQFWGHCMACSQLCGTIARRLGAQMLSPGEAIMSALLHDIGVIVLAANEKRQFTEILQTLQERYEQALEDRTEIPELALLEEEVLGFNHADLGAWLARKWNLPPAIVETIQYHHSPSISECLNKELVGLVQLTDFFCNRNGLDYLKPRGDCEPSKETLISLARSGQKDFQEKLKTSLQPEIERARKYFEAFAIGVTEEEQEPEHLQPLTRPKSKPVVETVGANSSDIPMWSALLPGLYQMLEGDFVLGLVFFVTAVLGIGFAITIGITGGLMGSLIAGTIGVASWVCSLILACTSR